MAPRSPQKTTAAQSLSSTPKSKQSMTPLTKKNQQKSKSGKQFKLQLTAASTPELKGKTDSLKGPKGKKSLKTPQSGAKLQQQNNMKLDSDSKDKSPDQLLTDILTAQTKRLQTKKRLRKQQEKEQVKRCLNQDFSNTLSSLDNDESLSNEEDESMLLKRVRKNRDQIKALHVAFQQSGGNWTKEEQKILARQLGLSEQQVYKWSWDQAQKRRRMEELKDQSDYQNLRPLNTDEFGGYSKTWLSKGCISSAPDRRNSDDFDTGLDSISQQIGLDIERKAQELIQQRSPDGFSKRQIAKPMNPNPFSIIAEIQKQQQEQLSNQKPRKNIKSHKTEILPEKIGQAKKQFPKTSPIKKSDKQDEGNQEQFNPKTKVSDFMSTLITKQFYQHVSMISQNNTPEDIKKMGNISPFITAAYQSSSLQKIIGLKQSPFVTPSFFPQQSSLFDKKAPNAKKIQNAAQSLFEDLEENADMDDIPQMPVLNQKQASLRANQTISPMYFLMPKETAQPIGQNQTHQQTPMRILSSVKSTKMTIFSPSPHLLKPFY